MSLLNSFQIGLSGLNSSNKKLQSVSDNIANSGTNAFKKSRSEFDEALFEVSSSGRTSISGVGHSRDKMNFDQGEVAKTNSSTDMAIEGKGFFKVQTKLGPAYTRDGSFRFNKNGELTSSDGHQILGYKIGNDGKRTNVQGPIKVENLTQNGTGTKTVKMNLNLDAREDVKVFDPANPNETSNFSRTVEIYDNQGNKRLLEMYFTKTSNTTWEYNTLVDGAEITGGVAGEKVAVGKGVLTFDEEGKLLSDPPVPNVALFKDSGAQTFSFDFGNSLGEGGDGSLATTQYGTKSQSIKESVDGGSKGNIESITLAPGGILRVFYNNGNYKDEAQVVLANFTNEEGLVKVGSNLYRESATSGQAALGVAGERGLGDVTSKALEMSNVDMSSEFVEMLNTQRAFQASAKAVSVSDELLQKIINVRG